MECLARPFIYRHTIRVLQQCIKRSALCWCLIVGGVVNSFAQTFDTEIYLSLGGPLCSSPSDVMIQLQNFRGSEPLTEADIDWSVNGVQQPTYYWTGSVMGSFPTLPFKIGEISALSGEDVTVVASVSVLNEGTDADISDNTISSTFHPGLSGIYTIGGTGGAFPDLVSAVTQLNAVGVCGPVTFNIRDGFYDGQLSFSKIRGASADFPIVLQSESANAAAVTITSSTTENWWGIPVMFLGTSDVTLQNVTITGSTSKELLRMFGVRNLKIINTNIFATNGDAIGILADAANDSEIRGNRIEAGSFGIRLSSQSQAANNILIEENTLTDNTTGGIDASNASNLVIRKNIITQSSAQGSGYHALKVVMVESSKIFENRISTYQNGLLLFRGSGNLVYNNFIRIKDDAEDLTESCGLFAEEYSTESKILHNSILVEDQNPSSNAVGINFFGGEIINNIFSNTGGGISLALHEYDPLLKSHHNNAFTTGVHAFEIRKSTGNHQHVSELDEFTALTGLEQFSVSVDPLFLSSDDLHAESEKLVGLGTATSISHDIDGHARDAALPTIGADEFGALVALDLSIYAGPVMDLCSQTSLPEIFVRNTGTSIITSFEVRWAINGKTEKIATWTGTLESGEDVIYPISHDYRFDTIQNIQVRVLSPNMATDLRSFYNAKSMHFTKYSPVDLGSALQTICTNGEPYITLQPVSTHFSSYSWSDGSTHSFMYVSTSGTYDISVTDPNHCFSNDQTTVTLVRISPTINSTTDYICPDWGHTLTVKSPVNCNDCSYQWLRDAIPIENASKDFYKDHTGGAYSLTVTRSGCTEISPVKNIIMYVPIKPVLTVSATDICRGEEATITTPTGYVSFSWYSNNRGRVAVTDTTGVFKIRAFDGKCFIDSDPVTVTVHDPPVVTLLLDNLEVGPKKTICHPNPVVLRASVAAGANIISYIWTRNGAEIRGVNGDNISTPDGGVYSVTVASAYCVALALTPLEIVRGTVPTEPIIELPDKTTICPGELLTLKIQGKDPAFPVGYQWIRDDQPVPDGFSDFLLVSQAGNYQVMKTNGMCSITSAVTTITQGLAPAPPVLIQPPTACAGAVIDLDAPEGFDAYTWSSGQNTRSIQVVTAGNYSVRVKKGLCNSLPSNVVDVLFHPLPGLRYENGVLVATGGDTYVWFFNDAIVAQETDASLVPVASGIYYAEAFVENCSALSERLTVTITGVEDTKGSTASVYPNPARGFLNVSCPQGIASVVQCRIYDGLGNEVHALQSEYREDGFTLKISGLSAGTYYLHLGTSGSAKIIKFLVLP